MFLVSDTWGEYKKRYTGIHGFNVMGGVKPLSGVNLDDDEWNMLTHLMNLVLIERMDKFIHDECKANCEACQVNSDSQFDHCK